VLGVLPRTPVAPDGLTVADLVARGRHPHQAWYGQWSGDDEAAVAEALDWTGMTHQGDVLDLVGRLHRAMRRTVVMVLHDLNLAARYAGRLISCRWAGATEAEPRTTRLPGVARLSVPRYGVDEPGPRPVPCQPGQECQRQAPARWPATLLRGGVLRVTTRPS
jgi:hypothetical protein